MGHCCLSKTEKEKYKNIHLSLFDNHENEGRTNSNLEKFKNFFKFQSEVHAIDRVVNATEEVRKHFIVEDLLLGEGAFGKVFPAKSLDHPLKKYAIKILLLTNLTP
jgi:hypothetical protein